MRYIKALQKMIPKSNVKVGLFLPSMCVSSVGMEVVVLSDPGHSPPPPTTPTPPRKKEARSKLLDPNTVTHLMLKTCHIRALGVVCRFEPQKSTYLSAFF
jgi:hypothetical protein